VAAAAARVIPLPNILNPNLVSTKPPEDIRVQLHEALGLKGTSFKIEVASRNLWFEIVKIEQTPLSMVLTTG